MPATAPFIPVAAASTVHSEEADIPWKGRCLKCTPYAGAVRSGHTASTARSPRKLQRTPNVKAPIGNDTFCLYFPDQWDVKSPWHDVRVRQAALVLGLAPAPS